ncbi:MAG: protein kinase [Planctomycetes bacterium]|nr:protein kinase [Planctomycetota bacterium]
MPRLLVEKGPDRGKSVTIAVGGQIVAGRDKEANLQLSDTMASRRHFLIASKGSVFGLKDLNSANGTLVNGRQAAGAHKLAFGDSIQIGETLISWLPDEQTDTHGGLIGQQIGGYRIEERLGRGAMGTVYKATQLSLGRTVALKVLSQDLVKDEKFCEMFVKEARAAGSLNHPNIIQVYDVGDEGGQYFFSMEYASKGSVLEELTSKKSITLARAVKVIKDACNALDYAERKGLVHRDIKPDNLMVTEDDSVKLGDLGLAMSTQELQAEQDGVFGTPHYIAPEQAMGKAIDHRADIYALGATFYRTLTGKTLFTGATVKEILKKQVREPHTPITETVPDCPHAIARIIDRMLAKNPAERYQHASEIANDLSDWENLASRKAASDGSAFAGRATGLSADQSQQLADLTRQRKLIIVGVIALIALFGAAFSIWFFVFSGSSTANNITSNSNVAPSNNTPPTNSGPVVSDEVKAANKALDDALLYAEFKISDSKDDKEAYKAAIARLEEKLAENPKATDERKKLVTDRISELKDKLDAISKGAAAVADEWDQTFRDSEAAITEFHYQAAADLVQGFINKYQDSTNEEIKKIVEERAKDYYTRMYGASVRNHYETFSKAMTREVEDAEKSQTPELKAATAESVLARVRDAQGTCDQADYIGYLKVLGDSIEQKLTLFKSQAAAAERTAVEDAFTRCSGALQSVLEACRRDAARGDSKMVSQRLRDFELSNTDYIAYSDRPRFKPILDDINRREEQTTLEYQSLLKLVRADAMPDIIETNDLLKVHPWPADVVSFFGSAQAVLTIRVKSDLDNEQWSIELSDAKSGKVTKISAAEIDTRDKRMALAAAVTHLITYHAGTWAALQKPVASGGPPILVGLFAWMCELEAYDAAWSLIDHAWKNLDAKDPSYALVREYYAWGLLGLANSMAGRGDKNGAQQLLNRLESEFKDTRANQGRK